MFGNLGTGEIILILLIVLIFFGAKKIPELAQGLGKGLREFRKAAREAGVWVVTGDTKVVPKGAADKIFINTTGVGELIVDPAPSGDRAAPGVRREPAMPVATAHTAYGTCGLKVWIFKGEVLSRTEEASAEPASEAAAG